MTSIRETARAAQAAEMEGSDMPREFEQIANGMYDAIDALDAEKRSLLVQAALGRIHGVFQNSKGPGSGLGTLLASIAGYANESNREDAGYTSTGDTAVDGVLSQTTALLRAMMVEQVSPEEAAKIDAAADRVRDRVANGEDFEVVAKEEAEKAGLLHNHPVGAQVSTGPESGDRYSGDGLYL